MSLLATASIAASIPTLRPDDPSIIRSDALSEGDASLIPRANIGISLRIMPLGDSITWGNLSSIGNGYRGELAAYLDWTNLDFVGSKIGGQMADNDNEGHSGSFLADIKSYALLSVAARPNVILIHAGTNDMDLKTSPQPPGAWQLLLMRFLISVLIQWF